ncbi:MAG: SRPBCC family protein [Nitrososphaerales archaeon]|jgi:uncharacterized membrane protein
MTRVEDLVEILSPARTVWEVLTDASYLPKLYPDLMTSEIHPPGTLKVGSYMKALAKLGKVRVEVDVEVTRADPQVCFATRQKPGGLFKTFSQVVLLEPMGQQTKVKVVFDYTLVSEYANTITQEQFLDSRVADNLRWYTRNLKEICELLPLPS